MKSINWKWWQYGIFTMVSLALLLWCGSFLVASQPYSINYETERTYAILGLVVSMVFFPHALFQLMRTVIEKYSVNKSLARG